MDVPEHNKCDRKKSLNPATVCTEVLLSSLLLYGLRNPLPKRLSLSSAGKFLSVTFRICAPSKCGCESAETRSRGFSVLQVTTYRLPLLEKEGDIRKGGVGG